MTKLEQDYEALKRYNKSLLAYAESMEDMASEIITQKNQALRDYHKAKEYNKYLVDRVTRLELEDDRTRAKYME